MVFVDNSKRMGWVSRQFRTRPGYYTFIYTIKRYLMVNSCLTGPGYYMGADDFKTDCSYCVSIIAQPGRPDQAF
jgi:hypothetical protein